ncbi:oil body-associated protein 2C-like [Bidens hawaiensis]|uniref:oil body-associated protein 2C-like n=1 Tax=Bidens hawaiensis TaxID=980011 RepID=UPI004049410C
MSSTNNQNGAEKNGEPMAAKPLSMGQQILDKGAQMLQSFKPINQMSQHACTFALYSHDMTRQIETHHFITRVNQDFLQAAVYDTDDSSGRLIGIEYIVSDDIFEKLPPEEQKLWHSHAYEVKSGLWVHPRMPDMIVMPELKNLAKTYGKFWCTWQTDRGDKLPLGLPSLMMSPQAEGDGVVNPELVKKRDDNYKISKDDLMKSRMEIPEPEWINPMADYWRQHKKCFEVDVESIEINTQTNYS